MRPDREYQARLLAHSIIEGDRPADRFANWEDAAHPAVSVELRGMVRAIRQEFYLSGADLAEKVTAELERQLGEVNLDAMIAEAVRKEIAAQQSRLHEMSERVVRQWIESAMTQRMSDDYDKVRETAKWLASDALRKVAER